jgi:hypothetical protein
MAERDLLRLEYVPLSQVVLWERNPKQHDIGAIAESIRRHGFKDPLKYEPALNDGQGGIVEGGGRGVALQMMHGQEPDDPPRGIDVLKDTGEWAAPVLFGVDADSEAAAEAYGVDHNNLTYAGAPGVNPWDLMRMWDEEGYLSLVQGLAVEDVLPVSVSGDELDALLNPGIDYDELWRGMPEFEQEDAFGAVNSLKVHFATEEAIEEFAELVGQTVTKDTPYIWYPEMKDEDLKKVKCTDES